MYNKQTNKQTNLSFHIPSIYRDTHTHKIQRINYIFKCNIVKKHLIPCDDPSILEYIFVVDW